MARRCDLTGTGPLSGNNVSHSNVKTRTRFMPNLQHVSLMSDALGQAMTLRVTAATLRTIEHNGGLDKFLLKQSNTKITAKAQRIKRQIQKKLAA
jgi:large subunit ribosomal protein L28